jgi:hypothetical protein
MHSPHELAELDGHVAAGAKRADDGPAHPHRLRQTLATQAINRGMNLKRSRHFSGTDRCA